MNSLNATEEKSSPSEELMSFPSQGLSGFSSEKSHEKDRQVLRCRKWMFRLANCDDALERHFLSHHPRVLETGAGRDVTIKGLIKSDRWLFVQRQQDGYSSFPCCSSSARPRMLADQSGTCSSLSGSDSGRPSRRRPPPPPDGDLLTANTDMQMSDPQMMRAFPGVEATGLEMTPESLEREVDRIYESLEALEQNCIDACEKHMAVADMALAGVAPAEQLTPGQMENLTRMHRTLLNDYYDFILLSAHPLSTPALKALGAERGILARLWRHGILAPLDVLQASLPDSCEHILSFIDYAYQMDTMLDECVPQVHYSFAEHLADLSRFRFALAEGKDQKQVWAQICYEWHAVALDRSPASGKLSHSVGTVADAEGDHLKALCFYARALCVSQPSADAGEVLGLLKVVLQDDLRDGPGLDNCVMALAHAALFCNRRKYEVARLVAHWTRSVRGGRISSNPGRIVMSSYRIAIITACAMLGPNKEPDLKNGGIYNMLGAHDDVDQQMRFLAYLTNAIHEGITVDLCDDAWPLFPYLHCWLVFMHYVSFYPGALAAFFPTFRWKVLVRYLNRKLKCFRYCIRSPDRPGWEVEDFPRQCYPNPLPEDYDLRGLLWTDRYYPTDFFTDDRTPVAERYAENFWLGPRRLIRILWLGVRIARNSEILCYDVGTHQFSVGQ